jgi:hypothetical protein
MNKTFLVSMHAEIKGCMFIASNISFHAVAKMLDLL